MTATPTPIAVLDFEPSSFTSLGRAGWGEYFALVQFACGRTAWGWIQGDGDDGWALDYFEEE